MLTKFAKFLGLESQGSASDDSKSSETESVRQIIQSLDQLDADRAHYIALFASILSRVAYADLHMSEQETATIEEIVQKIGHLDEAQSVLVTQIAKNQNSLLGGVENYLITREFAKITSTSQRHELMESLFAVAAAEEGISSEENEEIRKIAEEIGLTRQDFVAVRASFKKHLNVLKGIS